ncbi:hypothetical protein P170DRAFT_429189 [Aspergillus steynii IBT 23096]|uniref:Uncharacterized protein n=1 Tax=Aspergillus steynii IBT 23096 TaxID=1392250 RepID=A0A2I2FZH6_9EURO|nr:uncharacterized protein P170DRAFT_429189 [Aspergillus steynii IBT 23096]PLB46032.1 hypothetical protein P170DRAFT_429189 [Aspergillus steynii IBT 23096]
MKYATLFLTLASLGRVYGQGSCQTSTVSSAACGSYPDGCPGSTFLSARGQCREQFGLADGSNCCCDCPGEEKRYHCMIQFIGQLGMPYGKKNMIGFCQDQVHYFAGNPDELFSEEDCKAAQDRMVKGLNDYYNKQNPRAGDWNHDTKEFISNNNKYFTAITPKGDTGTNSEGEKYWALKVMVATEKASSGKNIDKACPKPKGKTLRPAQCPLEKINACKHAFGGVFHGSTELWGVKPKNGVEKEPNNGTILDLHSSRQSISKIKQVRGGLVRIFHVFLAQASTLVLLHQAFKMQSASANLLCLPVKILEIITLHLEYAYTKECSPWGLERVVKNNNTRALFNLLVNGLDFNQYFRTTGRSTPIILTVYADLVLPEPPSIFSGSHVCEGLYKR